MATFNSKTDWEADVASDLVKVGTSEDGEDIIQACYYVTLTNSFGDRYRSKFCAFEMESVVRYSVLVGVYLRQGRSPVGSSKWELHHAVYGSAAYTAYGQAEEVAWEAKLDGRNY